MNGIILDQLTINSIIGFFAPFVLPTIFRLYEQFAKVTLTKEGKRKLITVVSAITAVIVVAITFEWHGLTLQEVGRFLGYNFANFATLKGTIQAVYEVIIKGVPDLDKALEG